MALNEKNWILINNDNVVVQNFKTIRNDILNEIAKIYNYPQENGKERWQMIPENSADYIFASNLSLSIWNLLSLVENIYKQHNVDFATGNYLDKLMGFYGLYRNRKRKYVIEATLVGDQATIDKFKNGEVKLYNYNFTDEEYKFSFRSGGDNPIINTNGDIEAAFLINAEDYYDTLTFDKLRNMSLNVEEGYLELKEGTKIVIKSFQAKEEGDESFRNRLLYQTFTSSTNLLYDKLKKLPGIDNVLIYGPSTLIEGIGDLKLHNGQIGFLIQYNELYETLSEQEKEYLNADIHYNIGEYSNIGNSFYDLSLDVDNSEENKAKNAKFGNEVTRKKVNYPTSYFISQTIIFNELKKRYGAIIFKTYPYNEESIKNKCEDLLEEFRRKSLLYQYNGFDVLNILKEFFNVVNNDLYFAHNNSNFEKIKLAKFEASENGVLDINNTNINLKSKDSDVIINIQNYNDLNKPFGDALYNDSNFYFKWNMTNYKYYLNADGTYTIILYGGDDVQDN